MQWILGLTAKYRYGINTDDLPLRNCKANRRFLKSYQLLLIPGFLKSPVFKAKCKIFSIIVSCKKNRHS